MHTPYFLMAGGMALAFILATPIIVLASLCVIQHVFIMKKGLDASTVNLLLGMLGAATGGIISAGATIFSKAMTGASSVFSKTTVVSQVNQDGGGLPPPGGVSPAPSSALPAKAAPPQEVN